MKEEDVREGERKKKSERLRGEDKGEGPENNFPGTFLRGGRAWKQKRKKRNRAAAKRRGWEGKKTRGWLGFGLGFALLGFWA